MTAFDDARRPEREYKKWICIDFDGVIHAYTSRWQGATVIPDGPVPGALEFLKKMQYDGWRICILSSRAKWVWGRMAIRHWLRNTWPDEWQEDLMACSWTGFEFIKVSHKKVPALIYIDDRGYRFEGKFPTDKELDRKPWNKL